MNTAEITSTPDGCTLKRKSIFSDNKAEMFIPVSAERVFNFITGKDLRVATAAFPELNADQREFIMTGCTPGEWKAMMDETDPGDD